MTFKNQYTAYFNLRALTTHANVPQDLEGYWTKVHQILTRHRRIIVDVNATTDFAILPTVVECQRRECRRSSRLTMTYFHSIYQLFWPPWCRAKKCKDFAALAVRSPIWRYSNKLFSIQFFNNVTNQHRLTSQGTTSCRTTWRLYRDHRLHQCLK